MSRARTTSLIIALASFVALGCSSNPNATDAYNQFIGAYCQRLQTCFPDTRTSGGADGGDEGGTTGTGAFSVIYPNGVSQCVQAYPAPSSLDGKTEACSQDQVNTCTNDIKNVNCTSLALSGSVAFPSSCSGC